jgi:hypothetical protein
MVAEEMFAHYGETFHKPNKYTNDLQNFIKTK